MTRDEHLAFCRRCKNRAFNANDGIICGLTNRIADFESSCPSYSIDESVKIEDPAKATAENFIEPGDISNEAKNNLRLQQDTVYAIIGGSSSAIVGALLWTLITVTTKYQIGYMAIGIGFIVGFGVRFFGAGIDRYFGIIGGAFALFGCLLGNLLSQVYFVAEAERLGYFETLTLLNIDVINSIFTESAHPMDFLFYGIAITAGYRYAFRKITDELLQQAEAGALPIPPFSQFRNVGVIILFLFLSIGGYFLYTAAGGERTFYYESGTPQSKGEIVNGREHGYWEMYWENGNPMANGYFNNGIPEGEWTYFNEEGELFRIGTYKAGLKEGKWTEFYANKQVASVGDFEFDRQSGEWVYYYEDGTLNGRTSFTLDMPEGNFETYYPDGTPNTKGIYKRGDPVGQWTFYYPNGKQMQETEYISKNVIKILNSWDDSGKPEVVNGEGLYKRRNEDGATIESGMVKRGLQTGIWTSYYANGRKHETGEYIDTVYYVQNSWDAAGKPLVLNSNGYYENYHDNEGENVREYGLIRNGLRHEKWEYYYPTGIISVESTYDLGKLHGPYLGYGENGSLSVDGKFENDHRAGLWTWYHENGKKSSTSMYIKGKKEGDQLFYNEAEKPIRIEVYKNGELVEKRSL